MKPEQSNILFKLMEERYHQHPTIITTNLVYDEWPNFLGSRIVQYKMILKMEAG